MQELLPRPWNTRADDDRAEGALFFAVVSAPAKPHCPPGGDPRGPFAPVSAGLVVPADGACRFVDRAARPGRTYCYRLDVVHSGGGTTATGIVRERGAP